MKRSNPFLTVAAAALFLALQAGCGGSDSSTPPAPDDGESRRQGESLDSVESRWKRAVRDEPKGVSATLDISGDALFLTTQGQAQVDAPAELAVEGGFPNSQHCVFFSEAQVGSQKGLLALEGPQVQLTAGTLGLVDVTSAVARTQPPSGSTTPVVELTSAKNVTGATPTATFPDDWSGTGDTLFFSSGTSVQLSNVTLSGFTRGLLITGSGNTPITGSVTVSSATGMYWDSKSRIQVAASTIHSSRFALGGEVTGGALTSSDVQALSAPPSMLKGHEAEVTLRPGSAKIPSPFQLTQAVTQDEKMLIPSDVELAFDTDPVTVKKGERALIPVVFREKGLRGDAVLADLQVSGSGMEAVSVPLGDVDSLLDTLWKEVGDTGIAAPFLEIGLIPLSPFIALGDALVCLLTTCPQAYPVWASAGTVQRFHIIVQGKLDPGTYQATVTLTGRNYATQTIPVQFTITE